MTRRCSSSLVCQPLVTSYVIDAYRACGTREYQHDAPRLMVDTQVRSPYYFTDELYTGNTTGSFPDTVCVNRNCSKARSNKKAS